MGRQLFLHHYLPAHLASCLVTGALAQFLFSRGFDGPVSPGVVIPPTTPAVKSPRGYQPAVAAVHQHDQWVLRAVGAVIVGALIFAFLCFVPVTYGFPGCSVEDVRSMKWLDTWDFHFAK
jgi:dolichyl-phosphate-mannose-protein mannosyltransferase